MGAAGRRCRAQAGEAPAPGKGSSWDRSPPGSAHSWRKRHFWGQTSAWEKFQGCLWSAAVAELLGPGAAGMVLGEWGTWWGGCSLWAREGITTNGKRAKLQAGCWEQPRRIPRVQPGFEAFLGTLHVVPQFSCCAELPAGRFWLAVLPAGSAGSVRQCLREAALPVPPARPCTGKPSHVRPVTLPAAISRQSACPCWSHGHHLAPSSSTRWVPLPVPQQHHFLPSQA